MSKVIAKSDITINVARGASLANGKQAHEDVSATFRKGDLVDDRHLAVLASPEHFERVSEAEEREIRRARLMGIDPERDGERAKSPHEERATQMAAQQTPSGPYGHGRDLALRTVDQAYRSGLLPDYAAERVQHLVGDGPDMAQFLASRWAVATGDPDYRTAFAKKLADPDNARDLWTEGERRAWQRVMTYQAEMRAMGLSDTAGGFMVPFTLDPAILLTSAGSTNPLRRIARVVQTVTDQWSGITSAGVTAEWKAEAAETADAAPTVANPNIPVHFGDAFVPYSFEIGMDTANFLAELQKVLLDGADQLQATAFTTGTGTGQPKGIITALAGTASEINAATDDVFARADVYSLQNALPPRFQGNAQWCANLAIINLMSQMELSTGGSRVFPELADGRLLNRPINELSNMDGTITTSGAVSNFVLLYGDFSNFVIVDRIGTTLELVPHLVGTNRRPTGQRGALLWFRTGSDAPNVNGFRLLDVASAA